MYPGRVQKPQLEAVATGSLKDLAQPKGEDGDAAYAPAKAGPRSKQAHR